MTWIAYITSLAAFFSVAAVNYAAANDCYIQERRCQMDCINQHDFFGKDACQSRCSDAGAACQRLEGANARYEELKARAIEERRHITCTERVGNVQNCVQHGRDLF